MAGVDNLPGGHSAPAQFLDSKAQLELAMALLFSLPILPALKRWRDTILTRPGQRLHPWLDAVVHLTQLTVLAGLLYFATISLAAGAYSPFIYLKF